MIKKDLFELEEADLEKFPIWYFPMDESKYDETLIKPVKNKEILLQDYQIIVRTDFTDNNNNKYVGYIYWDNTKLIKRIKPTIVYKEININFWKGIRKPSEEEINTLCGKIGRNIFPVRFKSFEGEELGSVEGTLEGLYYMTLKKEIELITF